MTPYERRGQTPAETSRRSSRRLDRTAAALHGSAGRIGFYAALIIFALIFLYPFVIQLARASRPTPTRRPTRSAWCPTRSHLAAFERLASTDFPLWFVNSAWVAVMRHARPGVLRLAGRVRAGPAALPGAAALFAAIIAVMAVPGVVLLIPKFLVLNQLGHVRLLRPR